MLTSDSISELFKVKGEQTSEKGSTTRLDGKHGDYFKFKFRCRSADWIRTISKESRESPGVLTADDSTQETVEEVQEAAGEAGEHSARRRRREAERIEAVQKSSVKQAIDASRRSPQIVKVAEKRKAEAISTTATSTAGGEASTNANEQRGPHPTPVSPMDPQVRAEKIRKLKVGWHLIVCSRTLLTVRKREEASLEIEILRRLEVSASSIHVIDGRYSDALNRLDRRRSATNSTNYKRKGDWEGRAFRN